MTKTHDNKVSLEALENLRCGKCCEETEQERAGNRQGEKGVQFEMGWHWEVSFEQKVFKESYF